MDQQSFPHPLVRSFIYYSYEHTCVHIKTNTNTCTHWRIHTDISTHLRTDDLVPLIRWFLLSFFLSFLHSAVCTRIITVHDFFQSDFSRLRSSTSSFRFQSPLVSLRSSSSCLHLLLPLVACVLFFLVRQSLLSFLLSFLQYVFYEAFPTQDMTNPVILPSFYFL